VVAWGISEEDDMGRIIDGRKLEKSLEGLEFPALKRDIVGHAADKGADEVVLRALDENLGHHEYSSLEEVLDACVQKSLTDP
jgi:hypothetical protein